MLDNTEFLTVIHELVSDSKACIDKLVAYGTTIDDQELKSLTIASASLLTIHNNLIVQLAEQNADIVDRANKLLEQLQSLKKEASE